MLFPAVVGVVVATVSLRLGWNRHAPDPLERHERALAALRDLADHPRAMPPAPPPPATDHVHLVSAPAGPRPVRVPTGARRRPPRPTRPAETDDRPVGAWLPARPASLPLADSAAARATPPDPDPPAPDPVARSGPSPAPPSRDRSGIRRAPLVVAVVAGVVATAAVGAAATGPDRTPLRLPARGPRQSTPTPTAASAPTTVPPPRVVVSGSEAVVTLSGPAIVTVAATARCWVRIERPDGTTVREETLDSGTNRAIDARAAVTVDVGNLPGLAFAVNGRPLSLTGLPATARVRFERSGSG